MMSHQMEHTLKHLPQPAERRIRRVALATAIAAAALAAASLRPAPASAMTLKTSVERMSATSSRVVLGTVTSVGPIMDGNGGVETLARVAVGKALKGRATGEVTVVYPGGTVGDVTIVVPDAPALLPGQTALFFLDALGRPVAWQQAVLDVRRGVVASERQTLAHVEARIEASADMPEEALSVAPTDSALLESAPLATTGPAIGAVTPGTASAGTGTKVVITGSGFGTTAGTVEFYYRSGQPAILGTVSSWTNTRIEATVPVGRVNGYAASAGSGPLTVRTSGGATAQSSFNVTFGFGGNRWANGLIQFKVNPNGPIAGTRGAADGAASAWTGAANLKMVDVGLSSASGNAIGDGNAISWMSLPSGVLGQASMRYSSGQMVETDFSFNSDYAHWGDGSTGTIDLQSVATHEMGHWLDLRDLYGPGDAGKVMNGVIGTGVRRRSLTSGDIAGARYGYGSPPPTAPITRISGTDRYATSVAVSRSTFTTATTVVLATGEDFPDALGASGLAGSYRGPLLLTRSDSLPDAVRAEIVRLKATRVVIVGGTGAVGSAVARSVDAIPGVAVGRIAGGDRYATAAAVAAKIAEREGTGREAFLVRGDSFADALAVAPYAYSQRLPVLLTARTGLSAPTRSAVGSASALVIAGSTSAVPSNIVSALGTSDTVRIAGADRYATASAMVGYAVTRGWTAPAVVGVATGSDFPDALGGGAAMGASGGGLLLTSPATLSGAAANRIAASKATIKSVKVYGSTRAVSSAAVTGISLALR